MEICTGNLLNVVSRVVNGKLKVVALRQNGVKQEIPLPDPHGLLEVLKRELETEEREKLMEGAK